MQHMGHPSHAYFEIYIQCLMATIVSRHTGLFIPVILIFSQLVIFSLEDDRIWCVKHYWICPEMKIYFKFHDKSLKQMPFDYITWNAAVCHKKKKLCQKFIRHKKTTTASYQTFIESDFKTLWHPTENISQSWEWINYSDTQKYLLFSKLCHHKYIDTKTCCCRIFG